MQNSFIGTTNFALIICKKVHCCHLLLYPRSWVWILNIGIKNLIVYPEKSQCHRNTGKVWGGFSFQNKHAQRRLCGEIHWHVHRIGVHRISVQSSKQEQRITLLGESWRNFKLINLLGQMGFICVYSNLNKQFHMQQSWIILYSDWDWASQLSKLHATLYGVIILKSVTRLGSLYFCRWVPKVATGLFIKGFSASFIFSIRQV